MRTAIIAGTAALLLPAFAAPADYVGLSLEPIDNGGAAPGTTWHVYVLLSHEDDEVTAVYGDALSSLRVMAPDGFYQNEFGAATSDAINPALFVTFPSLEFDSFATIGLLDQTGNAMLDVGINWAPFEAGNALETGNGTWWCLRTTLSERCFRGAMSCGARRSR